MSKFKDIAYRAAMTFVQSFVAALIVPSDVYDAGAWEAAALAAGAAAVSAVMNTVKASVAKL